MLGKLEQDVAHVNHTLQELSKFMKDPELVKNRIPEDFKIPDCILDKYNTLPQCAECRIKKVCEELRKAWFQGKQDPECMERYGESEKYDCNYCGSDIACEVATFGFEAWEG